ncbi:TPR repeat-containing protein DDB_G0287407-like [Ptychodera flava]|uniref:TPR repeat-containing protein DDB_G0287407-like n=1 Tax=Ptychodera flava TaxID=63121 RepID=UPI00396A83BF
MSETRQVSLPDNTSGKTTLRKIRHAVSFTRGLQTETQERRIVRVFFSSPFRGLELEREELTKKYWPRLSTMCSKAGYEFVPVDLRWGITSEKTSNAGTLEVCLREVDRSDMFVGFFGQRYGWHGVDDDLLQRSFDVAASTKPWLNQYRDRSVTEIEFLHGHLNHPGDKPACFFFRDKEYDDKMLKTHKSAKNEVEASKYDPRTDGPRAEEMLGDLQQRVKDTKDTCFAFTEAYPDPQTGAKLMFEAVKRYLEQTVLADPAEAISEREKERLLHNAYYISRLGVGARREYIGGDRYLKEVDRHVLSDVEGYTRKPLLVLGDPGFGKTTLLANWLHRHQQLYPEDVVAYHFVGCTPNSSKEKNALIRLVEELMVGFDEKSSDIEQPTSDTNPSHGNTEEKPATEEASRASDEKGLQDGEDNKPGTEAPAVDDDPSKAVDDEKPITGVPVGDNKSSDANGDEKAFNTMSVAGDNPSQAGNEEKTNSEGLNAADRAPDGNEDEEPDTGTAVTNSKTSTTAANIEKKDEKKGKPPNVRSLGTYELFQKLETTLKSISESGKRAIIIIDALNKMDPTPKTRKQLYWLPTELPEGVSILVSSLTDDTSKTNELINERHWDTLVVEPMEVDDRKKMIMEMLSLRGKELTSSQVDKIIKKEQSANALFLKIFVQELCNFGDFWRLDEHLNFLLGAESTKELFAKILERLEIDFNPQDSKENTICKVMCCLLESRYGLSDHEIKELMEIPDHVWSAIFFAMEDFFIDRGGLYGFAFDELAAAVQSRYLEKEDEPRTYSKMLADYHQGKLDARGVQYQIRGHSFDRISQELPWLLQKLDDKEHLKRCLTHLGVFDGLLATHDTIIDLYAFWRSTEVSGKEMCSLYMKSLDERVAALYIQREEEYCETLSPVKDLLPTLYNIAEIIGDAGHLRHTIPILERALRYQEYAHTTEEIYENQKVADMYIELVNKLACVYCDLEMFEESEKLHKLNIEIKEKLEEKWKTYGYQIGITLNGLALLCKGQGKYDEAEKHFQRCLELHRARPGNNQRLVGASLNNIGTLLMKMKKFQEAIGYFEQTLEMYAICYFGRFHTEIAGTMNNLAVCYRNLKQMDKAEPIYEKAYNMTVNAFGDKHPEVALKLMNWGTFNLHMKNYEKSLEMFHKSFDIYKECFGDEHIQTILIMENIAMACALLNRHEEGDPYFKKAGEALHRQGRLDVSLKGLNRRMLRYYLEQDRMDDAEKLLERILNTAVDEPRYFFALAELDKTKPENERPKRPHQQTVEFAAEKYPESEDSLECMDDWFDDVDRTINLLKIGKYGHIAYINLYTKYSEQDHNKEGVQVLHAGMEMFPNEPAIYLKLAKEHAANEEDDKAVELLNKGLTFDPNDVDILTSLGEVLIKRGESETAGLHLRKALELAAEDNVKVEKIEEMLKKIT